MIVGIGCDIVRVSRISRLLEIYGDHFKNRVFTIEEITAADDISSKLLQCRYYAKRFAAKEALSKAVGTGISGKFGFLDITVTNYASGAPRIICSKLNEVKAYISLSDEDDFAIAYVILEQR